MKKYKSHVVYGILSTISYMWVRDMKKKILQLVIFASLFVVGVNVFADGESVVTYNSPSNDTPEVKTRYGTYADMNNVNESAGATAQLGFTPGWYGHKRDVTYIKLIGVGAQDMGLSALYSKTGLECPIDDYLYFKKSSTKPNAYVYTVGNGCLATITVDPTQKSFTMTVNSRSKCFEEYTYQQFCDGNLDQQNLNEQLSTYFIGDKFIYTKDQNDDDYDYNDD